MTQQFYTMDNQRFYFDLFDTEIEGIANLKENQLKYFVTGLISNGADFSVVFEEVVKNVSRKATVTIYNSATDYDFEKFYNDVVRGFYNNYV